MRVYLENYNIRRTYFNFIFPPLFSLKISVHRRVTENLRSTQSIFSTTYRVIEGSMLIPEEDPILSVFS